MNRNSALFTRQATTRNEALISLDILTIDAPSSPEVPEGVSPITLLALVLSCTAGLRKRCVFRLSQAAADSRVAGETEKKWREAPSGPDSLLYVSYANIYSGSLNTRIERECMSCDLVT
jgi:hypothetical protein